MKKTTSQYSKRVSANTLMGQHFLRSTGVAAGIIDCAGVTPEDTVLEIGPGEGILTSLLAKKARRVVAIEKDERFRDLLGELTKKNPNLRVFFGDVLRTQRSTLGLKNHQYKVVANIPYYITSHLLRTLLEERPRPFSITIMVQLEVAKRIVVRPPKMNLLALSVQAYGEPIFQKKVDKKMFRPEPEVDSAIISIENISDSFFRKNGIEEKTFFGMAKRAFGQKRKMLKNSLGINSKKRPQELALRDWATLAKK